MSISVPDEIATAAKDAGVNISALATEALRDELDRLAKIAELDAYLDSAETDQGPIDDEDVAEAGRWVEELVSEHRPDESA